jgi:hypothetical protein
MLYIAYLREQAAYYRALADKSSEVNEPEQVAEYKELAETCEEVASEIEDHLPSG